MRSVSRIPGILLLLLLITVAAVAEVKPVEEPADNLWT